MGLASKLKSFFKIKRKEKIEFLVNELIKELKKDGKSIASPQTSKDFGHFGIWVFNLDSKDERVLISKIGEWEIRVKPTFKEF